VPDDPQIPLLLALSITHKPLEGVVFPIVISRASQDYARPGLANSECVSVYAWITSQPPPSCG